VLLAVTTAHPITSNNFSDFFLYIFYFKESNYFLLFSSNILKIAFPYYFSISFKYFLKSMLGKKERGNIRRDKCIISHCDRPKLQNDSCGIKMNYDVLVVSQKNNLVSVVKFC
jgi:hypothetical protein